jgi:hypothetical protein
MVKTNYTRKRTSKKTKVTIHKNLFNKFKDSLFVKLKYMILIKIKKGFILQSFIHIDNYVYSKIFNKIELNFINNLIKYFINDRVLYCESFDKFNYFIKNEIYATPIKNYINNFIKFKKLFHSTNDFYLEVFKRKDIYCFGMILLKAAMYNIEKSNDVIDKNLVLQIFKLFEKCSISNFSIKYLKIDTIIQDLTRIINIIKGGDIMQGYNGMVFMNPRLRCINETYNEYDEVSKVSFKKKMNESYLLPSLINSLNNDEIYELNKYAIIPQRLCEIDPIILNELYKQYPKLNINNSQIITKKGGDTLLKIFETQQDSLLSQLEKLINVANGIKFLHDRNFIHCDIKLENIIQSENTYKLIDFDECFNPKNDYEKRNVLINYVSSMPFDTYNPPYNIFLSSIVE